MTPNKDQGIDLPRLVEDGSMADSLDDLFAGVVDVGAVAGREHCLYRWLIERRMHRLVEKRPYVKGRLSAEFLGGSQLMISWNGRPDSPRRLLLFAHTDHEGYEVDGIRMSDTPSATVSLEGSNVCGQRVEPWRKEAKVVIRFDVGAEQRTVDGVLTGIGGHGNGSSHRVSIEATPKSEAQREELRRACEDSMSVVVAEHAFTPASPGVGSGGNWADDGTPTWRVRDFVEAPCIDNSAGVAVCTLALEELAKHNAEANLSVLYTTGEEAGFLGLLSLITGGETAFHDLIRQAVCVVVDSSKVDSSVRAGIGDWHRRRWIERDHCVRDELSENSAARCPLDVAAIRLEDVWSLYDVGVARLLYQSALGVQRKVGHELRSQDPEWIGRVGVAGEFYGGICEGTLLSMYPRLRQEWMGDRTAPGLGVGSLAIPITNYRNEFGIAYPRMKPEVSQAGALYSAALIVLNAAVNLGQSVLPSSKAGTIRDAGSLHDWYVRERSFEGGVEDVHGHVLNGRLKEDFECGQQALGRLRSWVESEGAALAEEI